MPSSGFRVIQITDCHLLADPSASLRGWLNQPALEAVLAHVRENYPKIDAVLLTGDLAHDESAAAYRRLANAIRTLGAPIYALPGNHDDPALMRACMTEIQVGGTARIGPWRIHLLDSHVPGKPGGRLGRKALAALAEDLAAAPDAPTLVAVHHPPGPVGAPWLDAIRLADGDALLALLRRHRQVRAVLCGHVHQAFDGSAGGVRQLAAPAVTRQFLPGSTTSTEDPHRMPGYRALRFLRDGRLTTQVRRIARNEQVKPEKDRLSD